MRELNLREREAAGQGMADLGLSLEFFIMCGGFLPPEPVFRKRFAVKFGAVWGGSQPARELWVWWYESPSATFPLSPYERVTQHLTLPLSLFLVLGITGPEPRWDTEVQTDVTTHFKALPRPLSVTSWLFQRPPHTLVHESEAAWWCRREWNLQTKDQASFHMYEQGQPSLSLHLQFYLA